MRNYKLYKVYSFLPGLIVILSLMYLVACESRTGITDPYNPPPPPPNPYGEGNGKITFYRTENIDGPLVIKISNKTITDSLVWNSEPNCDTNIAASVILRKGDYNVNINGASFSCLYNVTVTEKQCIKLKYDGCSGGLVPCVGLEGTWQRTADGPCPNCQGLKIYFQNGTGEVIYTPPGCRFPLGDLKWINYDSLNCSMMDLARDDYGGYPQYQNATTIFSDRNHFTINGESGVIPYSRISNSYDKTVSKNIHPNIVPADSAARVRLVQ